MNRNKKRILSHKEEIASITFKIRKIDVASCTVIPRSTYWKTAMI